MYVALGDSYAAGVGSGPRTDICWRAPDGYPPLVAAALGHPLAYQACFGATIADVHAHQLGALGNDSTEVTITVGGNDAGFAPVLICAAEPSWMCDSHSRIDAALAFIRDQLPARLTGLYDEVRAQAPYARVVVTTYPRLFNGTDCELATFFSGTEMRLLDEAADLIAEVIDVAARTAGFDVADVRASFDGHVVCDAEAWVRGVSWPVEESFHPNALGATAYARAVAAAFRVRLPAEPVSGAPEGTVDISAGPCVLGSAPGFALPDLLSDRSLDGAREHGLDPDEVARLARQATGNSGVGGDEGEAPESLLAWQRLHELDQAVRRHT